MRGAGRKGSRHHGKEFMNTKAKVEKFFGAEISITHNYEINYRFAWSCTKCGIEYRRRTKSVDVERYRSGECMGKLIQTKPVGNEELHTLTEAMGDVVLAEPADKDFSVLE